MRLYRECYYDAVHNWLPELSTRIVKTKSSSELRLWVRKNLKRIVESTTSSDSLEFKFKCDAENNPVSIVDNGDILIRVAVDYTLVSKLYYKDILVHSDGQVEYIQSKVNYYKLQENR